MTTIGFISDVHGNREALEAVLADIGLYGVDVLVCLGDVVGYGPDPDVCVDLVAGHCDVMIRGNHDEATLEHRLHPHFNPRAWRSVEESRRKLSPGHLMLLDSMRASAVIDGVSLAHGSFGAQPYRYLYTTESAQSAMALMPTTLGVVGHTHIPSCFVESNDQARGESRVECCRPAAFQPLALPTNTRIILNPGSVGQPRDRNPFASWGVIDSDERTFTVRRVPYDLSRTQQKIASMGLPEFYGERLRTGV